MGVLYPRHAGLSELVPRGPVVQGARNALANRLLDIYERTRTRRVGIGLKQSLSYSNARLPQALLIAGWRGDNKRMIEVACESLQWLAEEQHRDDKDFFVPIGSTGFFTAGEEKARFDQQPVEACATVSACFQAYEITGEAMACRSTVRVSLVSRGATICRFRFTTLRQAAAGMGFILIASMRIRARNPRCRS